MRLVMVAAYPAPGAAPVGGPQVATTRLVSALGRCGVEITVVAPGRTSRRESRRARGTSPAPRDPVRRQVVVAEGTSRAATTRAPHHRAPRCRSRACPRVGAIRHCRYRRAVASPDSDRARQHARRHARGDARRRRHLEGVRSRSAQQTCRRTSRCRHRRQPEPGTSTCRAEPRRFVYIPNIVDGRFYELDGRPSADWFCSQAGRGRSRAGPCSLRRGRLSRRSSGGASARRRLVEADAPDTRPGHDSMTVRGLAVSRRCRGSDGTCIRPRDSFAVRGVADHPRRSVGAWASRRGDGGRREWERSPRARRSWSRPEIRRSWRGGRNCTCRWWR